MIDAGPRLQQHPHCRLLLDVGERGRIIIDAELGQRAVQGNLPFATAMPIKALSRLLRTDASSVRLTVSPFRHHDARWITMKAVELICFDQSCTSASKVSDQPDCGGSTWSHSVREICPAPQRRRPNSSDARIA